MLQHDIVFLKSLLGSNGGLEKYTLRLAKAFSEKGLKVAILTTTSKKKELPIEPSIDIITLFEEGPLSFLNVKKFDYEVNKWLKNNPVKIVFGLDRNSFQTHYRAGNGVHEAYLKRRKKNEGFFKRLSFALNPLHNTILGLEKKTFEDPGLKCLFTNSHLVKNEILEHYKIASGKIAVIHNGVEWDELQESFNHQTFFKDGPYRILFVGHGYKRKGLDILLRALAKVRANFILTVIGKDKNASTFKKLAQDLGLEDRVIFHGPQKNIKPFYMQNDALVLPTTYDPFANVTLEALAVGLYVLTSKANGAHEIMSLNAGIVVNNVFDENQLASSLELLCKNRKTPHSANLIRQSVSELTFKNQLNKIINLTLCLTQDTFQINH